MGCGSSQEQLDYATVAARKSVFEEASRTNRRESDLKHRRQSVEAGLAKNGFPAGTSGSIYKEHHQDDNDDDDENLRDEALDSFDSPTGSFPKTPFSNNLTDIQEKDEDSPELTSQEYKGNTTPLAAFSDTKTTVNKIPTRQPSKLLSHQPRQASKQVSTQKTLSHHPSKFINVFAAPLDEIKTFIAPFFAKSQQELKFLERAIRQNFIFQHLSDKECRVLLEAFSQCFVPKGTNIITQGDVGDYFYVIFRGTVRFQVNGVDVGTAMSGQTFGELSLLYTSPRAATCIAEDDNGKLGGVDLFRVDQKTFRYILQSQTKQANQNKRELLQKIPFLNQLDEADITKLGLAMTPRPFRAGEFLVKKGQVGDAFYVIQEGTVRITDITVGNKSYEDQVLNKGDFFGERALMTREPRVANCVGVNDGLALCIDRETFEKVMGNLSRLIVKSTDKRLLGGIKVLQQTKLDQIDLKSMAELIVDDHFQKGLVLFQQDEKVESALYIIREGKVRLDSSNDRYDKKIIEKGGYFGEEMLCRDAQFGCKGDPISGARYTVTMLEDTTLGVLTLEECRTVVDTTQIGKGKRQGRFQSVVDSDIQLKALKKHAILGAGTFGQVWLVSRLGSDGRRVPYALKIQSKRELIENKQAKGVVQEKDLMQQLQHPFIIHLVNTYQDRTCVFMLLDVVQGGELFSLLHTEKSDGIPEEHAQFYGAAILEGLTFMHRRHILYRDLKPENVLIDEKGYPVIVDLGFAKYVTEKTYTLCGTPLYIAPEVILNRGHDKGADHWSLGVLLFEMVTGFTPFYKEGMDQITLFRAIVKGKYSVTTDLLSNKSARLILKLLIIDPTKRLGSLARGEKDIFQNSFFQEIEFEKLRKKELKAPWLPKLKNPLDSSHFEDWDHLEDKSKVNERAVSKKDDAIFKTF